MVEIYKFYTENISTYSLIELNSLFPLRFKKAMSYKNEKDQKTCLGAGIILHKILGLKESEIFYNEYGKPYCKNLNFSISHTEDSIYVVVSDKSEVGIDIENLNRDCSKITKIFHQNEIKSIKDHQFSEIEMWTRKEALLKNLGIGISTDLTKYDVSKPVIALDNKKIELFTARDGLIVVSVAIDINDQLGNSFKNIFKNRN